MLVDTFIEASIATKITSIVQQPTTYSFLYSNNPKTIQQHLTDTIVKTIPDEKKQTVRYSYNAIIGFILAIAAAIMLFTQYLIGLSNIYLLLAATMVSAIAILLSERALNEEGKGSALASIGFLLNTLVLVAALLVLMLLFAVWLILILL